MSAVEARIRRIGAAALLILAGADAHAEAGWTDHASVLELTPTIHEKYVVSLEVTKNPSGCRDKQSFYQFYRIRGADRMFDLFLEAMVHNRKVRVFVTGRCDIDGYSEISSASMGR